MKPFNWLKWKLRGRGLRARLEKSVERERYIRRIFEPVFDAGFLAAGGLHDPAQRAAAFDAWFKDIYPQVAIDWSSTSSGFREES